MIIEIVDIPNKPGGSFHSFVTKLPEAKSISINLPSDRPRPPPPLGHVPPPGMRDKLQDVPFFLKGMCWGYVCMYIYIYHCVYIYICIIKYYIYMYWSDAVGLLISSKFLSSYLVVDHTPLQNLSRSLGIQIFQIFPTEWKKIKFMFQSPPTR